MRRIITYDVCADPETPGQWLALRTIAYPHSPTGTGSRAASLHRQTLLGSCTAQASAQDRCRQDAATLRHFVYAHDQETTVT